ncbi:MAG: hypothetical protein F6K36_27995 [Symploca sp. SIO3C6]|nr:hypothetical protein [Symploca sp. SIO3C6]
MLSVGTPRLTSGVEVVHAVAGRLRLRASDSTSKEILETLAPQLRQQDGVRQVCINGTTGSLLISFEPSKLSLSQLLALLQQSGVSLAGESSPEANHTLLWSGACSQAYSKLQSLLPLFAGIVTTRQLGIQGWPAIPVYLMTTSVARQVLNNLDVGLSAALTGETSPEKSLEKVSELKGKLAADAVTNNLVQPTEVAYSIVHAIPGRIRFQIPRIAQDPEYLKQLQILLKADGRMTGIRIKGATGSLAITYKPDQHADAEMAAHLVALIQAAAEVIASRDTRATIVDSVSSAKASEVIALPKDAQRAPGAAAPKAITPTEESMASVPTSATDETSDSTLPTDSNLDEQPQPIVDESATSAEELPLPTTPEETSEEVEPTKINTESAQQPTVDEASDTFPSTEVTAELSEQAESAQLITWSRFKSAILCGMLRFLAKEPANSATV